MGKKDKFIDKANSQKFHLLHRSQRDEAHANFEVPSNFVLVPAVDNGNVNSNNNGGGGRFDSSRNSSKFSASKDHINELGFANDGYDYSKHLKQLGGGTFISKTGHAGTALDLNLLSRSEGTMIDLPEDCMPSANNLERNYEAITINHKLMDKDIRAALFDGFDEEGEFEELQDDFVSQVMNGPEDDDFDFDAHIAKLIARSERSLGIPNKEPNSRVRFAGDEGEEELGSSDDEFPDYLVDEGDFHLYQQNKSNTGGKRKKQGGRASEVGEEEDEEYDAEQLLGSRSAAKGAVGALSEQEREALELQFERTLAEYDDDELGYIEELQEEDIGGTIDFTEDGNLLDEVMDEFLQAEKDAVFAEGTNYRKGQRSSVVDPTLTNKAAHSEEEVELTAIDIQQERLEQQKLQEENEQVLLQLKREAANKDTSIESCQEYLREVRIDEEWDCETIVSTYSTLENHPTLIKDTNKKFKKYVSPHQRALDAAAAGSNMSSAGSVASRSMASRSKSGSTIYGTASSLTAKIPSSVPGKIVLTGKLNLPEGFGPTAYEKRKELPQRSLDSADAASVENGSSSNKNKVKSTKLKNIGKSELEEIVEEGSENDSENEDGSMDSFEERKKARKRREETPEEKKARKEAVKQERRNKRQGKKELKAAFRAEGSKMIRSVANEQSTDHVSMYRY